MPEAIWPLILVIAVLALVLALLFWGLGRLRKYLKAPSAFQAGAGWTLEEVRKLHQSGQLTDKQYQDLRDAVIRGLQKRHPEKRSRR